MSEDLLGNTEIAATRGIGPYEMVSKMLRSVDHKVQAPYGDTVEVFFTLIDILKKKRVYHGLAEHLIKQYGKLLGRGG